MKETFQRRFISPKMIFVLFAVSMPLAAVASAQGNRDFAPAQNSAPAQCGGDQLSLRQEGEDAAMGGLRSMKFVFTNTSSSPCTMKGYPRFELLTKSGRTARRGRAVKGLTRMGDDSKKPPQTVTIEPGKTAVFWIDYVARGAGATGKPCPTYRKFRIVAPGVRRAFVESGSYPIEVCSGLEVSPVRPPANQ